jgi:hypothetical protein
VSQDAGINKVWQAPMSTLNSQFPGLDCDHEIPA